MHIRLRVIPCDPSVRLTNQGVMIDVRMRIFGIVVPSFEGIKEKPASDKSFSRILLPFMSVHEGESAA